MAEPPVQTTVGERIALLRRERGLSQAQLAAATGVSRSAVAQWETDRAGQFTGNLTRIAQALDVSIELLLHGHTSHPSAGLTGDELALLRLYRLCNPTARADLLRLARKSVRPADPNPPANV